MKKIICLSAIMSLLSVQLFSQSRLINGNVKDEEGEPLTGVTVLVEGTQVASITDVNGDFNLVAPAGSGVLVVSYVGYETQRVALTAAMEYEIVLAISEQLLDEVLIVGYGTQIKSEVTGSIARVEGDAIENTPVTSVEQTLQGKAAGVFIEANNGKVGSAIRMRIRGSSSINANNEPLFVVDGVPINTTAINDGYYNYLNPLNDIDFNDIASVDILKDASASAIYGSRGANGVVLITTKRGQSGKAKFTFNYQQGISKPTRLREFLNAEQFVDYYTDAAVRGAKYAFANGVGNYDTEEEAIEDYLEDLTKDFERISGGTDYLNGEVDTDWQSLAFQDAVSRNADLSISGGTENFQYYMSTGFNQQDGIIIANNANRMSLVTNFDAKLAPRLNMGLSLNLARSFNEDVPSDYEFSTPLQLVALSPISPLYDSTGEYSNFPVTVYPNPLIDAYESVFNTVTFRNIGNLSAEYTLVKNFRLRGEAGADVSNLTTDRYYGQKTQLGESVGGYAENYAAKAENYDLKLLLLYNTIFASHHDLEVTAGTEYQRYNEIYAEVDGTGFPNDNLQTLNSAATIVYAAGAKTYYRFLSYFARANYNFKKKYLFSLTGRYDGSSRFGTNNRFGFFPSVSAGWLVNEENFLKESGVVSYLKLRASYGITGNAGIGNFSYLGLYGVSSYSDKSGLNPSTLSNPDLTWERTAQLNVGIDFGFLSNRINGEIDIYSKDTRDLLLDVPVPATTGFTTQLQNIGRLSNKGIEFVINSENLVGRFKWSTGFNFGANRNKILELAEGQDIIDLAGSESLNVVMVGEPIGVFYGPEYAGVDAANGDALWYVNDDENSEATTNNFNQANFVVVGDPNPDFVAGITNSFSYGGIFLDVTFQSVYGNDINLNGDHWMNGGAATFDNQITEGLNYWKEPGDITDIPEPRLGFDNGNQYRNSRYVSDGSYVRLKTITLGYTLPRKWTKEIEMDNLTVYLAGYNLLTFTDYAGWDPEVTSDGFSDNTLFGYDFYSAPHPKTIVIGTTLNF